MIAGLIIAIGSLAFLSPTSAIVTFRSSQVFGPDDFYNRDRVQIRCNAECIAYGVANDTSIQISYTDGGSQAETVVGSLSTLNPGFRNNGTVLANPTGRRTYFVRTQRPATVIPFVLYVVERGAANYGDPVYVIGGTAALGFNDLLPGARLTVLTLTGQLDAYSVTTAPVWSVYASGYDSFDECDALLTTRDTGITVRACVTSAYTPIYTVNFGSAKDGKVIARSMIDPNAPAYILDRHIIASPGFVGCRSTGNSAYYSALNSLNFSFYTTVDSLGSYEFYNVRLNGATPVTVTNTASQAQMIFTGAGSLVGDRNMISSNISVTYNRRSPTDSFALVAQAMWDGTTNITLTDTLVPYDTSGFSKNYGGSMYGF